MDQEAYERLKRSSNETLTHTNFALPFKLQTDASDSSISAVLVQDIEGAERVLMYLSRVLQTTEQKVGIQTYENNT